MRVIRTELYFEPQDVSAFMGYRRPRFAPRERDAEYPGVAFAWFRTPLPVDPAETPSILRPIRRRQSLEVTREQISGILDLFVRDADEGGFLRIPSDGSLENRRIVDFILDQEIVMERSPPFSISLKGVLDKANPPMWIGTMVGFGAALWDHPVLRLLTVCGGIIAVSSARGIGAALESGLQKTMKRLFNAP